MTGNEKIEDALKEYFEVTKLLDELGIKKEQLRGIIQTEMSLSNVETYTNDLGRAKFSVMKRTDIDKKRLAELVAPAIMEQVVIKKEFKRFEIRSQAGIDKSKTAFGG